MLGTHIVFTQTALLIESDRERKTKVLHVLILNTNVACKSLQLQFLKFKYTKIGSCVFVMIHYIIDSNVGVIIDYQK